MKNDLEIMRTFFTEDKFVALAGIEIEEVSMEKAVVSAVIEPRHLNANGFVQGGMLYTLADFAFAVLGNYSHPITVTQGGHISYLRPGTGKKVTATAVEKERAGHTTVCEVTVKGEDGKTICVCSFNGFVKDVDRDEFMKKYQDEQR